jgi:hypothetical protein
VGLIHGELNESNIGRRRDGTVVFLDWDQAGTSATALEYGYPLITTFIAEEDLAFDEATAAGFYAGYAEAGGVIEPSRLFDAALFHALRYMWFGDVTQRWERIAYAVRNEAALIAALF